jgi:hypothetical protein
MLWATVNEDGNPALMGDAKANDLVAKAAVSLNEVDPDRSTVDLTGELVLVDQGGSEIVTLAPSQGRLSRILSAVRASRAARGISTG